MSETFRAAVRLAIVACLTAAAWALAGCVSPVATPSPTSTPAPVPPTVIVAAASPTPSATPTPAVPTATPAPSPTLIPSPAPSRTAARREVQIPADPLVARAWNWARVVGTDPDLEHPDVPNFGVDFGPYVEARGDGGLIAAHGYATTASADLAFVDLDGDGKEEAAVLLFSGGTAGNTGLLVYRTTESYPRLAAVMGGYKLWAWTDGKELLVREPIYAGWEPNCCPGGFSERSYKLDGSRLVETLRVETGIEEAKALTVDEFYSRLRRRDFAAAYTFLSPAFQAAQPYPAWQSGYENTVAIEARVSEVAGGRVAVELTATDQTAAGSVTRRYRGSWSLVWSSAAAQWLLDQADIALVP